MNTNVMTLNIVTRRFSQLLNQLEGLVFDIDHFEGLKLRDEGGNLKK